MGRVPGAQPCGRLVQVCALRSPGLCGKALVLVAAGPVGPAGAQPQREGRHA